MSFNKINILGVELIDMRLLELELKRLNTLFQCNKINFMSIFDVFDF